MHLRVFFITCTHTGCAQRRAAQWAHVSWRRFSSAAHRSEKKQVTSSHKNHRLFCADARRDLVSVSVRIPPWWVCAWAREHTPGPRQHSSRHISSPTRRMGQRDGASPPATPAKPPPECPEARSRSANKPPTTAALVETHGQINTVMILCWSLSAPWSVCRNRERTFSSFPGFWGVWRPPVSKLEGEIKAMKKLMWKAPFQ